MAMLDPTSIITLEIGFSRRIYASSTLLSGRSQICLTLFTRPVRSFCSGIFSFLPVNLSAKAFLKISASFAVEKVVISFTYFTSASCDPFNHGFTA